MTVMSIIYRDENSVHPDRLASEKPVGLYIVGFQNRIYPCLACICSEFIEQKDMDRVSWCCQER